MLCHYFKLDDYFLLTQKYYYFFDGMFNYTKQSKMKVLESLLIPDSTYRTNRLKGYVKNQNHLVLLNHFHYNSLDASKKELYEACLSKIFNTIYYRELGELSLLEKELEKHILDHNLLEPIFILFKILIAITKNANYDILLETIESDLCYVESFPESYFTPKIHFLLMIVRFFCKRTIDENQFKNYALQFPEFSWMYHWFKGTFEYVHQHFLESVMHYRVAYQNFLGDMNVLRMMACINNICFLYNAIDQYELSLENSSKIINYTFYQCKNNKWMSYITMHYLYSNYMLNRYFNIVEFFKVYSLNKNILTDTSVLIGLLTARKLKKSPAHIHPILEELLTSSVVIKNLYQGAIDDVGKCDFFKKDLSDKQYLKKIIEKIKVDNKILLVAK